MLKYTKQNLVLESRLASIYIDGRVNNASGPKKLHKTTVLGLIFKKYQQGLICNELVVSAQ